MGRKQTKADGLLTTTSAAAPRASPIVEFRICWRSWLLAAWVMAGRSSAGEPFCYCCADQCCSALPTGQHANVANSLLTSFGLWAPFVP
jgi:hypothetical protein